MAEIPPHIKMVSLPSKYLILIPVKYGNIKTLHRLDLIINPI